MVVDLFIYFTGLTVTQNCWTDLHALFCKIIIKRLKLLKDVGLINPDPRVTNF